VKDFEADVMKLYDAVLRRWFVKRYIAMMMERVSRDGDRRIKLAKTSRERTELHQLVGEDIREYESWLQSIDDGELVKRAAKMDIWLDDIPLPDENLPDVIPGHWDVNDFGQRVLFPDFRLQLKELIRAKGPAYRKERRETYEFYFKIFGGVATAVAGLGGIVIGIISVIRK
jgi:hypothetical protein